MKAAFDGSVVRPPYAGVQLSVLAEMRALADRIDDLSACEFFCLDEDFRETVRQRGGRVGHLPGAASRVLSRIAWQQFVLPRQLKRSGAEVLHALAYTAPLRCPVPYVLNVHDIIALERPDLCAPRNRLHMRALLPGSIRRAAALIVSTRHVAERVHERFGIAYERITVAPLGVDAGRFAEPSPRPAFDPLRRNRPYILFVGNLEPKKSVDTLLDAYGACASADAVDLILAGRAAWMCSDLVERIQRWSGPGCVCWLGRTPATVLPGLLQHASVLVMPSVEEGFGMPVLEAMAAGTAVIHSDHPALAEAAGGAGMSFVRRDAEDFAAKLDLVLGDDARRQELIEAGRAHAATMTWARWADTAVDVLNTVARKG